jgi:XrtJ-associated TM-motif-TM protein
MKAFGRAFLLAAFLICVLPLRAQSGCDDSPEAPTALLALVGVAGGVITLARARFGRRR